tara:strand:+ start:1361 stop:1609 length:249 start_codon:yes stop_codon:yes gene_type:complete
MSKFQLTEVPFESSDFKPSLEDEFTTIAITRELESTNDPAKLKVAALNLLMVAMQRQAIIRNLCKRLASKNIPDSVKTTHTG